MPRKKDGGGDSGEFPVRVGRISNKEAPPTTERASAPRMESLDVPPWVLAITDPVEQKKVRALLSHIDRLQKQLDGDVRIFASDQDLSTTEQGGSKETMSPYLPEYWDEVPGGADAKNKAQELQRLHEEIQMYERRYKQRAPRGGSVIEGGMAQDEEDSDPAGKAVVFPSTIHVRQRALTGIEDAEAIVEQERQRVGGILERLRSYSTELENRIREHKGKKSPRQILYRDAVERAGFQSQTECAEYILRSRRRFSADTDVLKKLDQIEKYLTDIPISIAWLQDEEST